MKVKELLEHWSKGNGGRVTQEEYCMRLSERDAARIAALEQLFPGKPRDMLIGDLLSAALDELEAAMPYVPGERVISEDELGDPIFEDTGLTPRFMELTRRHMEKLNS
ncbi:type 1 pili tip component [Thioalkalivibrio denitrificans]|uniref:Type 1 pili tip component n=1 Tax=Thioalkalivibrio denitrificans TaxID=108003 RepID=A0A1V3ND34_9GAMM|nr:type 1 pili tip component [Thioalkalivibrio denitrificans]OOG22696.1 type 1 pili tip component [Thioalkalivibrio denitrificans]